MKHSYELRIEAIKEGIHPVFNWMEPHSTNAYAQMKKRREKGIQLINHAAAHLGVARKQSASQMLRWQRVHFQRARPF